RPTGRADLVAHRLELFRGGCSKVRITLLEAFGRLHHGEIMAELFQRHAQLLGEVSLLLKSHKKLAHLLLADVGVAQYRGHLAAHAVPGGRLFLQNGCPVGRGGLPLTPSMECGSKSVNCSELAGVLRASCSVSRTTSSP